MHMCSRIHAQTHCNRPDLHHPHIFAKKHLQFMRISHLTWKTWSVVQTIHDVHRTKRGEVSAVASEQGGPGFKAQPGQGLSV